MSRRFVATGTGHCGTKWFAEVANAAGIRCGHEQVYWWDDNEAGVSWDGYQADSSLAVAAHLGRLEPEVPVVHLIRDPVDVARSFMGRKFFHTTCDCHSPGAHLGAPYCRMVERHFPHVFDATDPLTRTVTYVGGWNLKIAGDCERFGLERLTLPITDPARTVDTLAAVSRGAADRDAALEAIDSLGSDVNRHDHDDTVTLDACLEADEFGLFRAWLDQPLVAG